MKKIRLFSSLFFISIAIHAKAQEKFTGIIEYKLSGISAKEQDQPAKMTMAYGNNKLMMKAFFAEDQKEEWILLDTEKDSMYSTSFSTKTYEREALVSKRSATELFEVTPLDSFKTFLDYRCRGYRISMNRETAFGYVWVTEHLLGLTIKKSYRHPFVQISGAPHVMLCVESYKNGRLDATFLPVSITKMNSMPDSLFALTGYTESKEPGIDAMLEAMNGAVSPAMPDTARYKKAKTTIKKKTTAGKPKPVNKNTTPKKRSAFNKYRASIKACHFLSLGEELKVRRNKKNQFLEIPYIALNHQGLNRMVCLNKKENGRVYKEWTKVNALPASVKSF